MEQYETDLYVKRYPAFVPATDSIVRFSSGLIYSSRLGKSVTNCAAAAFHFFLRFFFCSWTRNRYCFFSTKRWMAGHSDDLLYLFYLNCAGGNVEGSLVKPEYTNETVGLYKKGVALTQIN